MSSKLANVIQRGEWLGIDKTFSVAIAWEDLRHRGNVIAWTNIVWFAHCVPRHAFHAWLVKRRKLKTEDLLRQWDVGLLTDLNLSRCDDVHFANWCWTLTTICFSNAHTPRKFGLV
ncbi:reverse transcriptase domain, reverse transcriptase zinc-binding domain protein [Tanacetum coccineum]